MNLRDEVNDLLSALVLMRKASGSRSAYSTLMSAIVSSNSPYHEASSVGFTSIRIISNEGNLVLGMISTRAFAIGTTTSVRAANACATRARLS